MAESIEILPISLPPRLLTKDQAAAFCGLSVRGFTKARKATDDFGEPVLPDPVSLGGQELWHVELLRQRIDALAGLAVAHDQKDEAERRVKRWRQSK